MHARSARARAQEQYRLFRLLKPALDSGSLSQCQLRVDPHMATRLLDVYYSFDDRVMRELLGRKLNTKVLRELEAMCDRLSVPPPSVRRQFENLQRVVRFAEERDSPGGRGGGASAGAAGGGGERLSGEEGDGDAEGVTSALVAQLRESFHISAPLARRYVHVVFMCTHQLDTHHRRVQCLACADIEAVGAHLMRSWASVASGYDLEPELTLGLRRIAKAYLSDQRALSSLIHHVHHDFTQALPSISPDRPSSSLKAVGNAVSGCLKEMLRNLFDLAGSLSYAKVRPSFIHLFQL